MENLLVEDFDTAPLCTLTSYFSSPPPMKKKGEKKMAQSRKGTEANTTASQEERDGDECFSLT